MASHHTASYSRGHLGLAAALLGGPGDDVVVDVGDVRHVADLEAPELEEAPQHVEDEGEAAVPEVRDVVDGRAADVHRHAALLAQFEGSDRARRRVVEAQHSEYGNRTVDTTVDVSATTEMHPPELEAPRPPEVPDKPSLEGLEAKWSARWEEAGTYRFDRSAPRGAGLRHRHPAAHGVGLPAHRPHVLLHPHRRRRPLPAHAGLRGLLPDGVGRQRPPHRAPGAELLRRPLRPEPALRPVLLAAGEARARTPSSVSRPNFIELCDRLVVEDEKAFEHLWRTLGLSVDWSQTYATIDTTARRTSQHGFLRMLRAGHAYSAEAPTQWDVDFQTAVSQAEMEDRELAGAYHRLRFAHGRRPTARSRSRRTRPELLAACVALVAHPDDDRYRAAVRPRRDHAAVRGAGARPRPPARRSREGLGHRHDLHLRRHHRRDVVARAVAAHPDHRGAQRTAAGRAVGRRGVGLRGPAARRPAPTASSRAAPSPRPGRASWRCWPRPGRSSASPSPSATRSSSTSAATARSRSSPAGSGTCARWRMRERLLERGPRAALAPAPHAPPLRGVGRGAERRLEHQPAAVLRRAVPGVVPRATTTARSTTTTRSSPPRTACRSTRRATSPTGTARTSGASPGGFVGRPRRHGHLGDVVAHPADRRAP